MDFRQGSTFVEKKKCANHPWGFVADDVDDAPPCIAKCRERFLSEMLPKNKTFERLCEILEDSDQITSEEAFRAIYCCDAQLCGVDHMQMAGKDPNVDWVIGSCRNIGYDSLSDPGPPNSAYTCGRGAAYTGDPWCRDDSLTDTSTALASTGSSSSFDEASRTGDITSQFQVTASASLTVSSQPSTLYPTSSQGTVADTTSIHVSDTQNGAKHHGGMSTGVKVTIGLITAIVIVSTLVLLLFVLRKRRQLRKEVEREAKELMFPPLPPGGSLSPIVSLPDSHTDGNSNRLTPPPRLQERRLLPSALSNALSPSTGLMLEQPGFPLSPVISPMSSILSPRQERTLRRKNGSSPLANPEPSTPSNRARTSVQRAGSEISESPALNRTGKFPSNSGKPSPTRPPRPSDDFLYIVELISPGPPPTCALSSTPLPSTPPPGIRSSSPNKYNLSDSSNTTLANPSQDSVLSPDLRASLRVSDENVRDVCNSP